MSDTIPGQAEGHPEYVEQPQPPAPEKTPFFQRGWVRWVGGAVIAIWLFSQFGGDDEPTKASEETSQEATTDTEQKVDRTQPQAQAPEEEVPAPEEEPEPAEPAYDLEVDARTLIDAFDHNELQADLKYDNKTLKVNGVVTQIDTELFNEDKYTLSMTDGDKWAILSVTVDDIPKEELATVKVGQHVSVIADFDDGGDLGVLMNHGHLA